METDPGAQRSPAITGGGSGLGRSVALKLADKGYRVFGTALATAEVNELEDASHRSASGTAPSPLPAKPSTSPRPTSCA
jgi:NAD(P)-dependent dehydrogenase (short-subunit alcohol dehydrogenase family)